MNEKLYPYIPTPERVSGDYYIACHYYPGWSDDSLCMHGGFAEMRNYPDRKPLMGWYDSKDPMAVDWEIKWACEHGINSFIYCWYRHKDNTGKPVSRDTIRTGGLHEGFLRARFQHFMDFAIMWECQPTWGTVTDTDDLINNLLPFWVENYFSRPNYMSFDNIPYVYVYSPDNLVKAFGSAVKCSEALAICNEEIKKYGFSGIHFSCEQYRPDLDELRRLRTAGFDSSFQYGWYPEKTDISAAEYEKYLRTCTLPSQIVEDFEASRIEERIKHFPGYCMFTNSVSRNATEHWLGNFNATKLSNAELQWEFTHNEYRHSLERMKGIIDTLPDGDIGKKIVVLDNWNEWGEGHFIAPCVKNGFKYLEAVREVYTKRDNLPDYRSPETLGFELFDVNLQRG